MKKRVTMFLLAVSCFIFISCNNQKGDIKTVEDNKTEIAEKVAEAEKAGEAEKAAEAYLEKK